MVKVYWIASYPQLENNVPHSHSFWQLLVPTGGDGAVLVGEQSYPAVRGFALLVKPGVPHTVVRTEGQASPPKFIDVKFGVLDEALEQELLSLDCRVTLTDTDAALTQLKSILTEAQFQELFSGQVINMAFSTFLIGLVREHHGEKSAALAEYERAAVLDESYKGLAVSGLLEYINQNFDRIISLDDLSHFAHVSKTTLIEIFKEMYGSTPIRYLNNLRMRKAKELLADSDISVSEISEMVGFQSIHYFSRNFKEREGCTPMEYRRRYRDSRYITLESPSADR